MVPGLPAAVRTGPRRFRHPAADAQGELCLVREAHRGAMRINRAVSCRGPTPAIGCLRGVIRVQSGECAMNSWAVHLQSWLPCYLAVLFLAVFLCGGPAAQQVVPFESGIIWQEPKVITPGSNGGPPSDAIVLFDGKNFDAWVGGDKWQIENGEGVAKGLLTTKQPFGDCQLHLEFATPKEVKGKGQGRGNNGIGFMEARYEIQVLDSWENRTYFDGQCAALYKQRPPMVNVSRPPGEWQTYDIVFEAPRFTPAGVLDKPAIVTVLHNGVVVHNATPFWGPTAHRKIDPYTRETASGPIVLQDHGNPVRYR